MSEGSVAVFEQCDTSIVSDAMDDHDVPDIREGSFPVLGRQPTPRSG